MMIKNNVLIRRINTYFRYLFKVITFSFYLFTILFFSLESYSEQRQNIYLYLVKVLNLRLTSIVVEGRHNLPIDDLCSYIDCYKDTPIFEVNLENIEEKLRNSEWIKCGTVKRILPNSVHLEIQERIPIAIWQNNYKQHIIDKEGKIFNVQDIVNQFSKCLNVVGVGANLYAHTLIQDLSVDVELSEKIKVAVFYGERRWDIFLDDILIKMPEHGFSNAWKFISELNLQNKLFGNNIKVLDLRNAEKFYIESY